MPAYQGTNPPGGATMPDRELERLERERWKKAEAEWDASRQAAGAVPPLPQQNSNAAIPGSMPVIGAASDKPDDLEGGIRAAAELSRKIAEGPDRIAEMAKPLADAAAELARQAMRSPNYRPNRQEQEKTERRKSEIPAESVVMAERNLPILGMPLRDAIFYVSLAVFTAGLSYLPSNPPLAGGLLFWALSGSFIPSDIMCPRRIRIIRFGWSLLR